MADRYIKKDAIFKLIESMPLVDMILPVEFMKALYDIPAADVAPVRRGRWERPNGRPRSYMYQCSECREISFYLKHENCKYRFCPWCGTRMDGGET